MSMPPGSTYGQLLAQSPEASSYMPDRVHGFLIHHKSLQASNDNGNNPLFGYDGFAQAFNSVTTFPFKFAVRGSDGRVAQGMALNETAFDIKDSRIFSLDMVLAVVKCNGLTVQDLEDNNNPGKSATPYNCLPQQAQDVMKDVLMAIGDYTPPLDATPTLTPAGTSMTPTPLGPAPLPGMAPALAIDDAMLGDFKDFFDPDMDALGNIDNAVVAGDAEGTQRTKKGQGKKKQH
ncbi:hypothetical protein C0993_008207 [Termitomyces sp. T159_Od127]|nr:hypothetical protein C0993_008207 [Termitomyces sp. T159_Od127]